MSEHDPLGSVPGLAKIARIRVVEVCNIDSSRMTLEIWLELSAKVDAVLAEDDGRGEKLRALFK